MSTLARNSAAADGTILSDAVNHIRHLPQKQQYDNNNADEKRMPPSYGKNEPGCKKISHSP